MMPTLSENLNDKHLFERYREGDYLYYTNPAGGKSVTGSLGLTDDPIRDNKAQREAGGESRRSREHEWGSDDGGHIIGARFGGMCREENLVPQNRNFNRGAYKRAENSWAEHLENGDKVFVSIEYSGEERPESCLGYAIIEKPSGERELEYYSFYNESSIEQSRWEEDFEDYIDMESANGLAEEAQDKFLPAREDLTETEREGSAEYELSAEEETCSMTEGNEYGTDGCPSGGQETGQDYGW